MSHLSPGTILLKSEIKKIVGHKRERVTDTYSNANYLICNLF